MRKTPVGNEREELPEVEVASKSRGATKLARAALASALIS